jgi:hypothetical protein
MRYLVGLVLLVSAVVIASSAIGAGAPSRPPGVSADDWAPVSDSLGVVLVHRPAGPIAVAPTALLPMPPAEGYFMVRRGKEWQRLVVVEPAGWKYAD